MSTRGLSRIPKKEIKAIKLEVSKIGAVIQRRRKDLGFTQESFAERVDLSVNTVKYIEQGRRFPSLPMLILLTRALKLEMLIKEKP